METRASEVGNNMYGGVRFQPNKMELILRKFLSQLAESFDARLKSSKKGTLMQRFLPAEWDGYVKSTDPKHNPAVLIAWFTEKYPDKEFHIKTDEPQEVEVFRKDYKDKKYFQ